jgi:hypothetical protein
MEVAWLTVEAALEGIDSEASTAPIDVEDRAAVQAVKANNRKALIMNVNLFFMITFLGRVITLKPGANRYKVSFNLISRSGGLLQ